MTSHRTYLYEAGLFAVALLGALPAIAPAQTALPQATVGAASAQQLDPPGQVARLNLVDGNVSHSSAESGDWRAAQLNRPLTGGDRLWADQRSRAELHVGSTAVRLDERTSLDIVALDDNLTQLRLTQGTINLRVRALYDGQRFEVDTPNLAFIASQPGEYRIDADPSGNTTRVVVLSGGALLYGNSGQPFALGNRLQAAFTGNELAQVNLPGATLADTFDAWAADRNRLEDQSVSARYIPREIPGYQQLDSYGDWSQDPSYGPVWIPRAMPVDWAPYRVGHWSWIAPWGWTWVDDAPWGFAPFHYGRWAQLGPRWAWVPGRLAPRPVYAPALVAFVGGGSGGVNWNVSAGGGGPRPGLGWFPLAPGEAWRPAFRASPRYITRVNNNIVINNNSVTQVYRYQRQPGAVTAVSRDDFERGRPVRGGVAIGTGELGRAQIVDGRGDLPRRPDRRDETRPATGALPPPAATSRPVVNLPPGRPGEARGEGPRDGRRADGQGRGAGRDGPDGRDGRDGRPDGRPNPPNNPNSPDRGQGGRPSAAAPPAGQPPTGGPPAVTPPQPSATRPGFMSPQPTQQPQRDGERGRRDQPRADSPAGEESIGQRALREQAAQQQRDARQQQTQQQQAQREQQRQQHEQARQQAEQRRQGEESIGQRALREQAAQQQRDARQQAEGRRQQEQQQRQQQAQQQQAERQQQMQQQQAQRAQQAEQRAQQQQQQNEARQPREQRPPQRREGPPDKP